MKKFIIFFLFIHFKALVAAVDPPNYHFSLDALKVFYPNSTLNKIKEAHGEFEIIEKQGSRLVLRFSVEHLRYKFPVFVEVEGEAPISFFASLPSYFIHDVFHQSLINRYGPQDHYHRQENTAVYQWKDKEGLHLIYSGSCTITCFPIFLAGVGKDERLLKKIREGK